MDKEEFKQKYLTDAFFWINKENHLEIQKILQEFDIYMHMGDGFISWHDGFNNLCTFPPDKFTTCEYYQKIDMWLPFQRYGDPKNIEKLLNDYNKLD